MKALRPAFDETTSSAEWRAQLKQILTSKPKSRVAIVGVGHPFRGDDYAGSVILKNIVEQVDGTPPEGVFLFNVEDNAEAFVMKIASLSPDDVIFIDVCDMKSDIGSIRLVPVAQTAYHFFTTHGVPMKVLAEHLLLSSRVWILAIQPALLGFGEKLSPEIRRIVLSVSRFISELLEERLAG